MQIATMDTNTDNLPSDRERKARLYLEHTDECPEPGRNDS